ncbi:MAG TPA: L-threonylcarbamoyladenylate synthase [Clostridia bacterium]|nr:L-threonylcarbamoyladenylate synthase [Clostridia bacterium]
MQTAILNSDNHGIETAAKILNDGGLVGIPTETVYGLAANALDGKAVSKIFKAKGRPQDNPLIVHISDFEQIFPLVRYVPLKAFALAKAFWPGPLTIICKKSDLVPEQVSAGLDTVAIRIPSHPIARQIIQKAAIPLAAPSANLSGSPSPTTAQHVFNDLNGKIPAIVDGGRCDVGIESTVITLVCDTPRVLRPGGISPAQLEEVLGKIEMDDSVLKMIKENAPVVSPGMKYKHYSPNADVTILKGSLDKFVAYVKRFDKESVVALCFDKEDEIIPIKCITYGEKDKPNQQAQNLFDALRKVDTVGAKKVFARCPDVNGIGLAVYNRMLRASEFKVIEL